MNQVIWKLDLDDEEKEYGFVFDESRHDELAKRAIALGFGELLECCKRDWPKEDYEDLINRVRDVMKMRWL